MAHQSSKAYIGICDTGEFKTLNIEASTRSESDGWLQQGYTEVAARSKTTITETVAQLSRLLRLGYEPVDLIDVPTAIWMSAIPCWYPFKHARVLPGQYVLNLGCGSGLDVMLTARQVGPVGRSIGIDFCAAMIRVAVRGLSSLDLCNTCYLVADFREIPLQSESVDVVLVNSSLSSSVCRRAAFREVSRVLRRRGQLVAGEVVRSSNSHLSPRTATAAKWIHTLATREDYREMLNESSLRLTEEREPLGQPPTDFPVSTVVFTADKTQ